MSFPRDADIAMNEVSSGTRKRKWTVLNLTLMCHGYSESSPGARNHVHIESNR